MVPSNNICAMLRFAMSTSQSCLHTVSVNNCAQSVQLIYISPIVYSSYNLTNMLTHYSNKNSTWELITLLECLFLLGDHNYGRSLASPTRGSRTRSVFHVRKRYIMSRENTTLGKIALFVGRSVDSFRGSIADSM